MRNMYVSLTICRCSVHQDTFVLFRCIVLVEPAFCVTRTSERVSRNHLEIICKIVLISMFQETLFSEVISFWVWLLLVNDTCKNNVKTRSHLAKTKAKIILWLISLYGFLFRARFRMMWMWIELYLVVHSWLDSIAFAWCECEYTFTLLCNHS